MPLLGRCAACAGRLSWGRFVRLLAVSLRGFRPDLREPLKNMQAGSPESPRQAKQNGEQKEPRLSRKWSRACGRNCFENAPKMVRKCSPEGPKWLQNRSRRPPGTLPKSPTESGDLFCSFFGPLGRPLGRSWRPLGPSGDLWGRSWGAPGVNFGLPGGSFWSFF